MPGYSTGSTGDFNPRSPRGGATLNIPEQLHFLLRFQSTLPTRGSDDAGRRAADRHRRDFNPRSPRGGATPSKFIHTFRRRRFQSTLPTRGSDQRRDGKHRRQRISIHAPHEGERPPAELAGLVDRWISIHAPHEGERLDAVDNKYKEILISIHAPHEGERQFNPQRLWSGRLFQSTLPTRGSDGHQSLLF